MKTKKIISLIVTFAYFLAFVISIYSFWIGFHAVDLSYNILALSYYENQTYYSDYGDVNNYGQLYSYTDVYRQGLNQMFLGFTIAIVISLVFLWSWKK